MEASALHAPSFAHRSGGRARVLRLRSDEQLLALFRRGSDEAFGVIFDRYRSRLLAYTRRMLAGSQQDAEDALQDVFLRAYSTLRADERPVSVRAWLYRVAHNRCIDQIRRATPLPEDVFAVSRPTAAHDPVAAFQRREDLRLFVADVADLPETQRSALLLREMEGLSYAELCDTLDLSVGAVKSLLVRARTSLAETGEARATPCPDIRLDITAAHDAGTRVDSRARRHLRECTGCTEYRAALRAEPRQAAAHTGPLGFLAKLLGLGSAPVAGGGGAVAAGGTAISGKVAAIVCCGIAAAGAGAAAELPRDASPQASASAPSGAVHRHAAASAPRASAAPSASSGPAVSAAGVAASRSAAPSPSARRPASPSSRSQAEKPPVAPVDKAKGNTSPAVSENGGLTKTSGGATAPSAAPTPKPVTPAASSTSPEVNGRDGTGAAPGTGSGAGTGSGSGSGASPGTPTPSASGNGRGGPTGGTGAGSSSSPSGPSAGGTTPAGSGSATGADPSAGTRPGTSAGTGSASTAATPTG